MLPNFEAPLEGAEPPRLACELSVLFVLGKSFGVYRCVDTYLF